MKRGKQRRLLGRVPEPHFWQSSLGIPPQGATRDEIAPLVEDAFLETLGDLAWSMFGEHWTAHKAACEELKKLEPDGLAALARFCAGHFLKRLPKDGITQSQLWDEFQLYVARMNHAYQDEGALADYLKDRIGKPGWQDFQRRLVQTLDAKESPEFRHRFIFCAFWDVFPLPLRFWADAAAAELLTSAGLKTNLDKVRNFRKEFRLRPGSPAIMKHYECFPPRKPGEEGRLAFGIDERAAGQHGLTATLRAYRKFAKLPDASKS